MSSLPQPFAADARSRRIRLIAAVAVALLHLAAIAILMFGRSHSEPVRQNVAATLIVPTALPPDPPPPAPEQASDQARPRDAAAPPDLRSDPIPIVAPPPVIVLPTPIAAPPIAGEGAFDRAGAAEVAGPGSGAGGIGEGRGGGGLGGDGLGGRPPRWRKGRIRNSDYPRDAGEAGVSGTVGVRYRVGIDGRVTDCRITVSSGDPMLDATTCRLIAARFRFDPARDDAGRAVPSEIVERHSWLIAADPSPERP